MEFTKPELKHIIISILFIVSSLQSHSQTRLPELSMKYTGGNTIELTSFINEQPTLVIFWATWCKPCLEELDNIADLYPDWIDELDFDMIAVCIDDTRSSSSIKAFADGKDWPFNVVIDENQELKRAMNITDIPAFIIFGGDGEIITRHTGYSEGNEYIMFEKIRKSDGEK